MDIYCNADSEFIQLFHLLVLSQIEVNLDDFNELVEFLDIIAILLRNLIVLSFLQKTLKFFFLWLKSPFNT